MCRAELSCARMEGKYAGSVALAAWGFALLFQVFTLCFGPFLFPEQRPLHGVVLEIQFNFLVTYHVSWFSLRSKQYYCVISVERALGWCSLEVKVLLGTAIVFFILLILLKDKWRLKRSVWRSHISSLFKYTYSRLFPSTPSSRFSSSSCSNHVTVDPNGGYGSCIFDCCSLAFSAFSF